MSKNQIAASLALLAFSAAAAAEPPLGLPPTPVPEDNPQSQAKILLGERLFNDTRFSATGKVSCATCHDPAQAFTDGKPVSEGVNDLHGTRNAPTVVNAAYMETQFWDGREPSLEEQSKQPMVNPVEMANPDHDAVVAKVRQDPSYVKAFRKVFGAKAEDITIDQVAKAIAAFERTVVAADSPFDRWFYGGEEDALTEQQKRGYQLYIGKARCVSCHSIEQDRALFTDNRFHNLGVGFKKIREQETEIAHKFLEAKRQGADVDKTVLSDPKASELGRFAVTEEINKIGAFKTATLRNVEKTAPYMHDGSLETLRDVVVFYNNGGRLEKDDPVSDFQSGGIRPLGLTDEEIDDVVAFLEALTSPDLDQLAQKTGDEQ